MITFLKLALDSLIIFLVRRTDTRPDSTVRIIFHVFWPLTCPGVQPRLMTTPGAFYYLTNHEADMKCKHNTGNCCCIHISQPLTLTITVKMILLDNAPPLLPLSPPPPSFLPAPCRNRTRCISELLNKLECELHKKVQAFRGLLELLSRAG